MHPNPLGIAVRELLSKGCVYEREIRSQGMAHGLVLKQGLQSFILIAQKAYPDLEDEQIETHRFIVTTSFNQDQPLILAYMPPEQRMRFYVFDAWKIKEEKEMLNWSWGTGGYITSSFPLKLGWRWKPSTDLYRFWESVKKHRYRTVALDRFLAGR